jgi:hypothetical protein
MEDENGFGLGGAEAMAVTDAVVPQDTTDITPSQVSYLHPYR